MLSGCQNGRGGISVFGKTNLYFYHEGGLVLNQKIEKLRAQNEKDKVRLEQLLHEQQRLKNRISYLEKGERQKRAHRLITKGAAIDCLVPATKEMGEAEFFSLMESIFALPSVEPLLPKEEEK